MKKLVPGRRGAHAGRGRAHRRDEPQPLEPVDDAVTLDAPAAGEADEVAQMAFAARLRQEDGEHSRARLGAK